MSNNTFCSLAGYEEKKEIMSIGTPPLLHEGGDPAGSLERVEYVKWNVAGRGEPGTNCGKIQRYKCPECDRIITVEHACMLRSCPNCAGPWASREASITKSRMERGKVTFQTRLHHVILSFEGENEHEWDRAQLQDFRKKCYKILRKSGIEGGGMVLHPFREDHDRMAFSTRGLHVHCFVVGQWLAQGDIIHRRTGIIFKRIGELKFYKQYKYVFEHCGISPGVHSITWFGNMSYRNFPKAENEKRGHGGGRGVDCPNCTTKMEPEEIQDTIAQDYIRMWRDYG